MPVFKLEKEPLFPNPALSEPDGLLAVGGDLSIERLLIAYQNGIFPWFSKGDPILWWSPNKRMVIFPEKFHVSRSLKKVLNNNEFDLRADTAFAKVIKKCAAISRKTESGTWITKKMISAYTKLHQSGFAHSIEAWKDGKLVGGIYGISLGKCFFGESMFSETSNASKAALAALCAKLLEWKFILIDCQFKTGHLESLGGIEIPKSEYLSYLTESAKHPVRPCSWTEFFKG